MKIQTMVGALMSAALVAGMIGCNSRPKSMVDVDQSVLPAPAKALLGQDATIDRVQEQTFRDGTKVYVISYTVDGQARKIKYNAKDHSNPSGVFNSRSVQQDRPYTLK